MFWGYRSLKTEHAQDDGSSNANYIDKIIPKAEQSIYKKTRSPLQSYRNN